jgi:hypothetical protein
MSDTPRWVVVVLVLVVIIGLVAFARGRAQHRGDETGAGSIGSALLVVGS